MCNCKNEFLKNLKEKFYPEATKIEFINLELFSQKLYSEVKITLPNKKKPVIQKILHSHCPICGNKYDV